MRKSLMQLPGPVSNASSESIDPAAGRQVMIGDPAEVQQHPMPQRIGE